MGRRHKKKPSIEVSRAYSVKGSHNGPAWARWKFDPEPVLRAARALKRHGGRIIRKPGGYSNSALVIVRASPSRHKALVVAVSARDGISVTRVATLGGRGHRSSIKWDWRDALHCSNCVECYALVRRGVNGKQEGQLCTACRKLSPLELLAMALLE